MWYTGELIASPIYDDDDDDGLEWCTQEVATLTPFLPGLFPFCTATAAIRNVLGNLAIKLMKSSLSVSCIG